MNPYTASDLPLHDLNTSDSCSAAGDLHKEFFGGADQSRDQCRGCRVWMSSMTHYRGPISNLITHVEVLSRGGGSNVTMVRLIEGGLDPGLATTVAELATICNRTDQRDRAEAIVASLVALAPADDLAGLGALAALSPALIRLSRRLITAGVRPEQADIDVIATAYERTSVVLTTNLGFEHWTEVLGNERLTGAALDRLTHRCTIIETAGESYRLQDAKRRRKTEP